MTKQSGFLSTHLEQNQDGTVLSTQQTPRKLHSRYTADVINFHASGQNIQVLVSLPQTSRVRGSSDKRFFLGPFFFNSLPLTRNFSWFCKNSLWEVWQLLAQGRSRGNYPIPHKHPQGSHEQHRDFLQVPVEITEPFEGRLQQQRWTGWAVRKKWAKELPNFSFGYFVS